ncbi:tetratricopeptide repeat protein [Halopseudomonas bauzanensis]|uniref:tetratricopeptide repeat protein n=1 Tax=Halopseudomonas bauzanensis TaxID=653930 RepID=UPI002555AF3D|nr:hypothetical protein [Halopseudomonas bauzanensis]
MNAISLDSAIVVTEISKRTLWRRLTDGQITRLGSDERGRAMLAFDDLVPLLCVPVEPDDYQLFIAADAGDSAAQNDLAQLFLDAGKPEIALYWLQSAVTAQQTVVSVDAMHNLSKLYFQGVGVPQDENTGLMWLAKAAAHGHVIAEQQMAALMQRAKSEG